MLNKQDWWKQLEPQWQSAFSSSVFLHSNEPGPSELDALFKFETLRLAGPAAPFPNLQFQLTNLSGVQHLVNLSILIFTHHAIQSVEEVGQLTQLRSLFLMNNRISNLKGIEALYNLEQLYVQFNQIESLQPLELLTNLKEVYVTDNSIVSLDGLNAAHSDKLTMFACRPNEHLKQKEILRVERELGIICR